MSKPTTPFQVRKSAVKWHLFPTPEGEARATQLNDLFNTGMPAVEAQIRAGAGIITTVKPLLDQVARMAHEPDAEGIGFDDEVVNLFLSEVEAYLSRRLELPDMDLYYELLV